MMRVDSAAEMPRGRGTNAGLFFVKLSSQPTRANCIRGNGILRPETLVRTGGSLARRPSSRLGRIVLAPPTCGTVEVFQTLCRLARWGDWLVVDVVLGNRSATPKIPGIRENNRDFPKKARPFAWFDPVKRSRIN